MKCTCTALTQALLAVSKSGLLIVAIPLAGFWYGSFWALIPSMTSELFGNRHVASNYGLIQLAVSSGSLVFSSLIAASVYTVAADDGPTDDDGDDGTEENCEGFSCYRTTFLAAAATNAVAVVCGLVLHRINSSLGAKH